MKSFSRVAGLVGWISISVLAQAGQPPSGFPWERVPDIRAADFKPEFLERVARQLEQVASYGRCTESISACLRKEPPHPTAARLARDVFLLMAGEASKDEIGKWVEMRRLMAHPKPEDVRGFRLEGLTPLGSPDAPVVIVEYSDFQCPFCAMVSPMLDRTIRDQADKARLYFKQFPIKGHPRALSAARACVAADGFGKFWEYCPKLFEHQADLTDDRLVQIAGQVGIDAKAFREKMEGEQVLDRIADEKMEGLKNRVQGTPAIFINGKELTGQPTPELLRDRIEEELDILNGRD
jgi:predicted DsbA family dithiol-disulfide isomerase